MGSVSWFLHNFLEPKRGVSQLFHAHLISSNFILLLPDPPFR